MAVKKSEAVLTAIGIKLAWLIVVLAFFTGGCAVSEKNSPSDVIEFSDASGDEDFDLLDEEFSDKQVEIADPLEFINRIMFGVNDGLYYMLIKPVTNVYTSVTPKPVRIGIRNFSNNLGTPLRFVNCHLQGKTEAADVELSRFLINSTFGVLGVGDPALDEHNLEPPSKEDFGQTMAKWGIGNGFYIVWPLLGPSTLRDSVGKAGGMFMSPFYYAGSSDALAAAGAVGFTNEMSFHKGQYEDFKGDAVDPYVALRDIYIQRRRKQIEE